MATRDMLRPPVMLPTARRPATRLHIVPAATPASSQLRHDETHFLKVLGVTPIIATSERGARLQRLLRSPDITTAGQLADALALSPVQLKRLCRRLFGIAPKALLIRHRLARTLGMLEHRPYTELRQHLDLGYCDQSHFIRDFKTFFGMPPTRYLAARG